MVFLVRATLLALAFSSSLTATERLPWFGNLYEVELRATYGYTGYPRLRPESGSGSPHGSSGHVTGLGVAMSPFENWSFEVEADTSATTRQSWDFSAFRLTSRYMYMNDICGDPVSVSFGAGLLFPSSISRKDPAQEYSGDLELELHGAIGKEICLRSCVLGRLWAVGGLVMNNRGAPWLFCEGAAEVNVGNSSTFRFFARTTRGLGVHSLDLPTFKGYGPINFASSDVGVRYTRHLSYFGQFSIDYSYRPYTLNRPEAVHQVALTYLFPFSF